MEAITVKHVRFSFFWFQPLREQWANPKNLTPDFEFMRDFDRFNLALRQKENAGTEVGITTPWPSYGDHHFWTKYLESLNYWNRSIDANKKYIIPLRERPAVEFKIEEMKVSILPEYYYFPYGVAVMLTFTIKTEKSELIPLQKMTAFMLRIRYERMIQAVWEDGSKDTLKLDSLAMKMLEKLLAKMFTTTIDIKSIEPFSMFSVIQGNCANGKTIIPNDETHRNLEAVTHWSHTWETDDLPDLENMILHEEKKPKATRFYCHRRGIAIWLPDLFGEDVAHKQNLSCFYRNQLMAALLTESLGSFLFEFTGNSGHNWFPEEKRCARLAADLIGRFYGGSRSTYRTLLPRRHINDQDGWLEAIEYSRDLFSFSPTK
jgi:hypothetical protein